MLETIFNILAHPLFRQVTMLGIGIVFVYLGLKAFQKIISSRVKEESSRFNARKFANIAAYFVIATMIYIIFNKQLKGFNITLGLIGAGIALGLRGSISSLVGWASITFGRTFSIGDRIETNGIIGDVIDVGFFSTSIMECRKWVDSDRYTGRTIKISNEQIFNAPIYNYSGDFPYIWDEITIPIRYENDLVLTKEILKSISAELTDEYQKKVVRYWNVMKKKYLLDETCVAPSVTIEITNNWVNFTSRYIVHYLHRTEVRSRMFFRFLEEIKKYPDKIEIANTTVEISGPSQMKVNVHQDHT